MTQPTDPYNPTNLVGTKGQLQSQTIVSILATMVVLIATSVFKIAVTDQQKQQIAEIVGGVVMLAGLVSAWYGRVKATKKIG